MERSGDGADRAGAAAAPRILGRYAIYEAIASGGMATVHYGRLLGPVGFSRTVAIKRLHPQFAQDPQFVSMFLDEARLAARIRHPNVVATLDVVASGAEIFLVMDYVHGESLSRIAREVAARDELVPLPIALRIVTDALQGLHAAHEARDEQGTALDIVHRDISPQNILLGTDGIARLVDFGVAKATGQGATTREGHVKGKLGYMSPEQLRGLKLTRQSDVHGMAIVLWELLTGRRLFLGATEADTIAKVVAHEITPASDFVKGLNPEVDDVLRRGLSDSLAERYATARDMCLALEACGEIASTMEVGDWVQAKIHDLLERRTSVVSAIESSYDFSAESAQAAARPSGSFPQAAKASAKEWVRQLSAGDSRDVPTRAAAASPLPAFDSSGGGDVAAAVQPTAPPDAIRWYAAFGAAAGLVGLALVVVALYGPSANTTAAVRPTGPVPRADVTATVPGPSIAPPAPLAPAVESGASALSPAPLAALPSSSSAAAPRAPPVLLTAPISRTRAALPPQPHPPPTTAPARSHDDIFNSRE